MTEEIRSNFENISIDDDYNENEKDDKFENIGTKDKNNWFDQIFLTISIIENNPPRFSHMNNVKSPLRFPGSQTNDKK